MSPGLRLLCPRGRGREGDGKGRCCWPPCGRRPGCCGDRADGPGFGCTSPSAVRSRKGAGFAGGQQDAACCVVWKWREGLFANAGGPSPESICACEGANSAVTAGGFFVGERARARSPSPSMKMASADKRWPLSTPADRLRGTPALQRPPVCVVCAENKLHPEHPSWLDVGEGGPGFCSTSPQRVISRGGGAPGGSSEAREEVASVGAANW